MSDTLFEFYHHSATASGSINGTGWFSQSLTPSITHQVTSVTIKAYREGSPGTVTLSIRAADGSELPTGADLASGTTDADTLTTSSAGEEREIFFTAAVELIAGTQYNIVARAPTGDGDNTFLWLLKNGGATYGAGLAGRSTDSGASWTAQFLFEHDFWFEEYGIEARVAIENYPKWLVEIDWNGDGDYEDTGEDITSDVKSFDTEWGKDRELSKATAAVLQATLKNSDHTYTPTYTSSPIFGDIQPGRRVRVTGIYPYDDFTDGAGIALEDHIVLHGRDTWTKQVDTAVIASNKLGPDGGGDIVYTLDCLIYDAHVQVKFTKGADNDPVLVFRFLDTNNYFYIRTEATNLAVRKVEAAGDTELAATAVAWAAAATKTVKVILHGTSIRVLVDGVEQITTTSAFNQTETKHGVGGEAAHANARWDDFGCYYCQFTGTLDRVVPSPSKRQQEAYLRASGDFKVAARTKLHAVLQAAASPPGDFVGGVVKEIMLHVEWVGGVGPYVIDDGEAVTAGAAGPKKSWWDKNALDAWHELEAEEHGFVYYDASGHLRFEDRGHRAAAPHDAAVATIYEHRATNSRYFIDPPGMVWDSGEKDVINRVLVKMRMSRQNDTDPIELWRCKQCDIADNQIAVSTLSLTPGQMKTIIWEATAYDYVTANAPITVDDWAAWTVNDGTGTDRTADVTVTNSSTKLTGKGGILTVTNTHGVDTVFMTLLKVRGTAWEIQEPTESIAEDSTSEDDYGEQMLTVSLVAQQTEAAAQSLATDIIAAEKDPRAKVQITLMNGTPENLVEILARSVSDRITLVDSDMTLNEAFYINKIALNVVEGGRWAYCTWTLEEVS